MRKYFLNFIYTLSSILLFSCTSSFPSLPSNTNSKHQFTSEANLLNETYNQKVEDFYHNGQEGIFIGKADVPIYYKTFEQKVSEKAIVISTGRTEAAIKYKELIYDLYKNGYSVYIHDHRGQGFSGRMTQNPEMGYVDDFQYYIDDLKYFFDQCIQTNAYDKTYLLSHSMGGTIGMSYIEQHPKDFTAAAFSSPMLGFSSYVNVLVKILVTEEPKYALGQSDYKAKKADFEENSLTNNRLRYDRMIDVYDENPKAKLGGATYNWIYKSVEHFDVIFDNINKIESPFIMFSAENEDIVNPSAAKKMIRKAKNLGKNCIAYQVENAKHELLLENDHQRNKTLHTLLDFYSQY